MTTAESKNKSLFVSEKENRLLRLNNKKVYDSFCTKESFNVRKLLVLKHILEDLELESKNQKLIKIKRRLNCVNRILLTQAKESSLHGEFLNRNTSYGFLNNNKIGRIFTEELSIPQFPRDLRFHLFKTDYQDFDIKNCHPTILYEFVYKNTSISAPYLTELVLDRESFRSKVSSQLNSNEDVKKVILIALYSGENYSSKSHILREFHSELTRIRVALRDFVREQPQYELIKEKKLNTIQSYYCMTIESETLLRLRSFLHEKIKDDTSSLHFIPFYDGAFVRHDNFFIDVKLDEYVREFNLSQQFLVFEKKVMSLPDDCVVTQSLYTDYENLQQTLNKLEVSDFNKLLLKMEIEPFSIPEPLFSELIQDIKEKKERFDKGESLEVGFKSGYIDPQYVFYVRQLSRKFYWKVRKKLMVETDCSLDALRDYCTFQKKRFE